MGFMAGFGSAFAQSFQQNEQNIAQHKEDAFRLQYQDYISQRDYRQKVDLENKKNLKMARSLVASAGAPAEAVSYVYDQLSGGMSPEYMQKYLSENQAVVTPNTNTTQPGEGATASDAQPADPRDNLTQNAAKSVDSQMQQSGMKAPQDGGIFGKVREGLHAAFGNSRSKDNSEEIAQLSGGTAEDVKNTLSGKGGVVPGQPVDGQPDVQIKWTPKGQTFEALRDKANNLGDAQALAVWAENNGTPEQKQYANDLLERYKQLKSHEIAQNAYALDPSKAPQRGMIRKKDGTGYEDKFVTADYSTGDPLNPIWRDENGKEVDPKTVAPVGQNQEKDIAAVADEQSEAMKPYEQAVTDQKNYIRTAADYIKLLKGPDGKYNGQTIDIAGNVQQFADRWRRAGINLADVVMPKGNIDDAAGAMAELDSVEKNLRKQLDSGKIIDRVQANAMKASLIDIQGTKLAYMLAAAANGSTKGISNADFNHFKDIVSGNGNPATAAAALAKSIELNNKNIGDQENAIKKGKGKAALYSGKYPGAPTGVGLGKSFQDDIASDPELTQAMKDINGEASTENNPGQQVETGTPVPDWAQNAKQPVMGLDGQEVLPGAWKYMSPALQDAIRKKNGL